MSPVRLLPLCLVPGALLAAPSPTVDFNRDVRPILEGACIHCHGPEKQEGDVRLDTKEAAFKGSGENPGVTPGDPEKSAIWWTTTLPKNDDLFMPPKKPLAAAQSDVLKAWVLAGAAWPDGLVLQEQPRMDFVNNIQPLFAKGGPFNEAERKMIRLWVEQGAIWPEGVKLGGPEPSGPADNLELAKQIRDKIVATHKEQSQGDMKSYDAKVPITGAAYSMVAIPSGEFLMGSPDKEAGRKPDEGPQHKVKIDPFWMGKFEVTWDEYEPFMITSVARRKNGTPETIPPDADAAFITSKPTTPYTEMSFGMGTKGFPAISMTEHAALKYCQWLSAQTGHFYRLPTEAEWEYACRAGTTTAYSWGDDPSKVGEYAWYWDNAGEKYQKIGLKKPNPWGLYDMHGNVIEWCLDWYEPYSAAAGENPYVKPGKLLYPRIARGGSWYDDADMLRSATRFKSNPKWKIQDPQLPKSIWYHTDGSWLGFRLVRPLKVPSAEEMFQIWNSGRGEENEVKDPKKG
jgi:formylglycine-generating enzyme required for sulfatase activity